MFWGVIGCCVAVRGWWLCLGVVGFLCSATWLLAVFRGLVGCCVPGLGRLLCPVALLAAGRDRLPRAVAWLVDVFRGVGGCCVPLRCWLLYVCS